MANAFYNEFKDNLGQGNIDLLTDTIKVILIDLADYTFSQTHTDLDDVPAGARVATGTLASKTLADGVFDASDTVLSAVTGDQSEALILYKDSGVESTSHLINYIDSFFGGAPITPTGADINIQWDDGSNKIFKI